MRPFFPDLREALSFLTVLPVRAVQRPAVEEAERLSRSMAWFPLVGAGIGAAAAGVARGSISFWTPAVSSLLGLAAVGLLTGGLHWDGYCDSMDGLAARKSPGQTLQVMRDSRVGALGACALFVMLALQWALLQSIPVHRWLPVWAAAGALSRWALVFSSYSFPYAAGREGLGRLVTGPKERLPLIAATALGIGFTVCGLGAGFAGIALGAAALGVWLMNRLFQSKCGGITGDTLGAVCMATETIVLLVAAAR